MKTKIAFVVLLGFSVSAMAQFKILTVENCLGIRTNAPKSELHVNGHALVESNVVSRSGQFIGNGGGLHGINPEGIVGGAVFITNGVFNFRITPINLWQSFVVNDLPPGWYYGGMQVVITNTPESWESTNPDLRFVKRIDYDSEGSTGFSWDLFWENFSMTDNTGITGDSAIVMTPSGNAPFHLSATNHMQFYTAFDYGVGADYVSGHFHFYLMRLTLESPE